MPPKKDDEDKKDDLDAKDIKIDDDKDSDEGTKTLEEQIQAGIDEALKPIKEKLDGAYDARDEAIAKVKDFERKEREAELARLEEEGKHKEAYESRLAEEKAETEALKKENVKLTRDISVKNELAKYEFRNGTASEMAFRNVADSLVQDDKGTWVHKSGDNIETTVKDFLENSDNSFLLKVKTSSGSGNDTEILPDTSGTESKSLFTKPIAEVLKLAGEGKLRKK